MQNWFRLRFCALFLVSTVISTTLVSTARANVRIAPSERNATLVKPAQARLDVQINPATRLARVTSTWVFSNESPANFEAAFMAQAPASAIMVRFAYWFHGQKTLARVVEKERAAQIYRDATAPPRRRDPALVEMVARNLLKVRISPVEAKVPLKIELVWLQPVELHNGVYQLTLPWRDADEKLSLDRYTLSVQIDGPLQNLKLSGAGTVTSNSRVYEGKGELPQNAVLKFLAPGVTTTFAMSGNKDGYLAWVIAESDWKKYGHEVKGWNLSAVHSRILSAKERLVVARFKDWDWRNTGKSEEAKLWWAAFELDALGQNEKNRARGLVLSKRFGLPSKWTSWLAIPDSERDRLYEIINRDKVRQARIAKGYLNPILIKEKTTGANKARLKKLEDQFRAQSRVLRQDPDAELRSLYGGAHYDLSSQIIYLLRERDPLKAAQLKRLSQQRARVQPYADAKKAAEQRATEADVKLQNRAIEITKRAAEAFLKGTETPALLAQTRAANNAPKEFTSVYETMRILGVAEVELRSQPERAAKVRALMQQLQTDYGLHPYAEGGPGLVNYAIGQAEEKVFGPRLGEINQALAAEVIAGREKGPRYAELEAERTALRARGTIWKGATELPLDNAIQDAYKERETLRAQPQLDQAKIDQLNADLERYKTFAGEKAYESALYWRRGELFEKLSTQVSDQWLKAKRSGNEVLASQLKARLTTLVEENSARENSSYRGEPVENFLKRAEYRDLEPRFNRLKTDLFNERGARVVNQARLQGLEAQLQKLRAEAPLSVDWMDSQIKNESYTVFFNLLKALETETAAPKPDAAVVANLKERLAQYGESDWYYHSGWPTGGRLLGPTEYNQVRGERIEVRANTQKALNRLANPNLSVQQREAIQTEVAQLHQRENQLRVRVGDPLIAVKAPANARQVVAVMENGEIKALQFDPLSKQWQARFDVPTYTADGTVKVQIIVVFRNGTRQKLTMRFNVDLIAPHGTPSLKLEGAKVVMSLETDGQTDRVTAFTPWGTRVELKRGDGGVFRSEVEVPVGFDGAPVVRFILTDQAHNRTEIAVDLTR